MLRFCIGLLIFAGLPSPLRAEPADLQSNSEFDSVPGALDRPVLPLRQQHWPGATVIAIIGVFLSAAVIGPIVVADRPADSEEFNRSPEAPPPEKP